MREKFYDYSDMEIVEQGQKKEKEKNNENFKRNNG